MKIRDNLREYLTSSPSSPSSPPPYPIPTIRGHLGRVCKCEMTVVVPGEWDAGHRAWVLSREARRAWVAVLRSGNSGGAGRGWRLGVVDAWGSPRATSGPGRGPGRCSVPTYVPITGRTCTAPLATPRPHSLRFGGVLTRLSRESLLLPLSAPFPIKRQDFFQGGKFPGSRYSRNGDQRVPSLCASAPPSRLRTQEAPRAGASECRPLQGRLAPPHAHRGQGDIRSSDSCPKGSGNV